MTLRDWRLLFREARSVHAQAHVPSKPRHVTSQKISRSPGRSSRFDKTKSSDSGSELRTLKAGLRAIRPLVDSAPTPFAALHRIVHRMYSVQFLLWFYRPDQTAPLIPRHPAVQFRSLTREATNSTHPKHKPPGVLFCGNDTANFGCAEIVAALAPQPRNRAGEPLALAPFMADRSRVFVARNGRSGIVVCLPATPGAVRGPSVGPAAPGGPGLPTVPPPPGALPGPPQGLSDDGGPREPEPRM